MRRRAPILVTALMLLAPVGACGDDGGSARPPGTTAPPGADTTTGDAPVSTASIPGDAGPPTTIDLDGFEPDHVEPPPVGGVPGTAVPTASEQRVALPGFGEVVVQVRTADGVVEWCVLLAETAAQTQRGLMEVTDADLGGYDGMLFRFTEARGGGFYMRNTPLPLEIAYLAADGAVVGIREMEPCDDVDGCPTYPPDSGGEFLRAVEVPVAAGGVRALGITDDPGVEVVDTGRTCPATV